MKRKRSDFSVVIRPVVAAGLTLACLSPASPLVLRAGEPAKSGERPRLSPEQEREIDTALDAYIRFLGSIETVRVEYASISVETTPDGEATGEKSESRGAIVLKKPNMLRQEKFEKGALSGVRTLDRKGKSVSWSKASNETWIDEHAEGPLNGWEADKDVLPFFYYPVMCMLCPDIDEGRRASLKRLAVSAGTEDLEGIPCRVIAFRGLGTRRGREGERARLWIGPDGAPVRCLYERDRPDSVTDGQINRYTCDTRFTAVWVGIDAPDTVFAFAPPEGGKVIRAEDREKCAEGPEEYLLTRGDVAPDFTAVDMAGQTVHLSDFKGKMVLLNFWSVG